MKAPIIDALFQALKEIFSFASEREKNLTRRELIKENRRLRRAVEYAERYFLLHDRIMEEKKKNALLKKYMRLFFRYNQ